MRIRRCLPSTAAIAMLFDYLPLPSPRVRVHRRAPRPLAAFESISAPSRPYDTTTNKIIGDDYDAAGNLRNDGFHDYKYDADGNLTSEDGNSTKYTYDALNQRVRIDQGGNATEFVFNQAGQRVSYWVPNAVNLTQGQTYLGSKPVYFYEAGVGHFQHQDWEGTERMRTTYNGAVEGTFQSLPFGDGFTTSSGTDNDPAHFAQLDHDYSSNTDHAAFRQYSNVQGRWLSPDPYNGSYDASNPQSLNRYAYVLNSPLSYTDPMGLRWVAVCINNPGTETGHSGTDPESMPTLKIRDPNQSTSGPDGPATDGPSTSWWNLPRNCQWVDDSQPIPAGFSVYATAQSPPAPSNGECDNACQLAHAFKKTGVYSLTSVCFPVAFYGASAAGAAGAVAVANAPEVYAATVGDYATWYGRAISLLNRVLGRAQSAPPVTAMAATVASLVSQLCSSH